MDSAKVAGLTIGLFIVAAGAVCGYRNRARLCPAFWFGITNNGRRHSFSTSNRPPVDKTDALTHIVVQQPSAATPPLSVPSIAADAVAQLHSPPLTFGRTVFFTPQLLAGPRFGPTTNISGGSNGNIRGGSNSSIDNRPPPPMLRLSMTPAFASPAIRTTTARSRSANPFVVVGSRPIPMSRSCPKLANTTIDSQRPSKTVTTVLPASIDYGATGHNITPFRPPSSPLPSSPLPLPLPPSSPLPLPPSSRLSLSPPVPKTDDVNSDVQQTKTNTAVDATALAAVAVVGAAVIRATQPKTGAEPRPPSETVANRQTGSDPYDGRWNSQPPDGHEPHRWRDLEAMPPATVASNITAAESS
jgi:hypothetical protein